MGELRVVLVGPPGAGKSAVGALLARRWGIEHWDTDAAIEAEQQRPIGEIFVTDGETAFRVFERRVVLAALRECDGVLSLGGGSVLDPDVRAALTGHRVVFLDVGIADAAGRVGFDTPRPLLAVNPRASWVRLMKARRPVYDSVATWRVDTAGLGEEAVTDQVASLVEAGA